MVGIEVAIWLIFAAVCASIAGNKGRNCVQWAGHRDAHRADRRGHRELPEAETGILRKFIAVGLTLVAAVGITACGSATQQNAASKDASAPVTWTASSLANWLENDNGFDGKGNVTNATCIHQQGNVWQCLGTWTPAEAGIKAEDPDPSLSESDIQAAIKQGTQRMTYQVTTSSDGTWIANPN